MTRSNFSPASRRRRRHVKTSSQSHSARLLFTFSCSGAIDVDLFQKIVAGAVIDSGVTAWATGRFGAGEDHPLLMTCPEGEYLKGLRLAVRP